MLCEYVAGEANVVDDANHHHDPPRVIWICMRHSATWMCPKESEIFDCVWRTVTSDPKSCNYSLKKKKK
jgi:hypothetical protein